MLALLFALLLGPSATARPPRYTPPAGVQCPLTIDGNLDRYDVHDATGRRVTAYGFGRAVGDAETVLDIEDRTTTRAAEGAMLITVGGLAIVAWGVSGAMTTAEKGHQASALGVGMAIGAANAVPFLAVGLGVLLSPRRLRPDTYWTFEEAEWLRHDCRAALTLRRDPRQTAGRSLRPRLPISIELGMPYP